MVITKTPFRISFFGGGTDYPQWYETHGGAVLSATIDKYCYITCRKLPPFFEHKHRLVYSVIENVISLSDIKHPSARETLKYLNYSDGFEIHHDGDLPARSGLGSSSSFTVGLVNAISALYEKILSKKDLAEKAIYIEQKLIGEYVGSQDQIAAAYGGFNLINFYQDSTFNVSQLFLNKNRLNEFHSHILFLFTGISRFASEVAKTKIDNFKIKEAELKLIQNMVNEAASIIQNANTPIEEFGRLLNESWLLKKSLSTMVSNLEIDGIYNTALKSGAYGGKLLGAGNGGFMIFIAPPEKHHAIKTSLSNYLHVPFNFEHEGSKVVLYQPDGLN